jgi:hypothetical protein
MHRLHVQGLDFVIESAPSLQYCKECLVVGLGDQIQRAKTFDGNQAWLDAPCLLQTQSPEVLDG